MIVTTIIAVIMIMTRKLVACDYAIAIPTDVCPNGAKIISHTSNKPTHTLKYVFTLRRHIV